MGLSVTDPTRMSRWKISCRCTGIQTYKYDPYRGAAPAYTALIRGETAAMIANLSGATAQAGAGNVQRSSRRRGPQRSKARPDLADRRGVRRAGLLDRPLGGVCSGLANLPQSARRQALRAAASRILATPEMVREPTRRTRWSANDMTSEQFVQLSSDDDYGELGTHQIKAAGITAAADDQVLNRGHHGAQSQKAAPL